MNKKIASKIAIGIILFVVILSGVLIWLENKKTTQEEISQIPPVSEKTNNPKENQHKPFVYGTIGGYLTGSSLEKITYPLIFDDIRIINEDQKLPAILFGPQKFENFEIFMSVSKAPRKDANNFKSILIGRDFVSEGVKTTKEGYVGEVLSSQVCNLIYHYFIPLTYSNNDLELEIRVSQFELDPAIPNCIISDDQNYNYLKTMVDYVIDNIQPAL
jgi:hypothetical protein